MLFTIIFLFEKVDFAKFSEYTEEQNEPKIQTNSSKGERRGAVRRHAGRRSRRSAAAGGPRRRAA